MGEKKQIGLVQMLGILDTPRSSFHDLRDQPDLIFSRLKDGRRDHMALVAFLTNLQRIHKDFGFAIHQVAKPASLTTFGAVKNCWEAICQTQADLSRHHERIAVNLEQFLEKIQNSINSSNSQCNQYEKEWKQRREHLKKSNEKVDQAKRRYDRAYQRYKGSLNSYNRIALQKGDASKDARARLQSLTHARNEHDTRRTKYTSECANHLQKSIKMDKRVEEILDELQRFEKSRLSQSKAIFTTIKNLLDATRQKHETLIEQSLVPSIDKVDPKNEIKQFVTRYASATVLSHEELCSPSYYPDLEPRQRNIPPVLQRTNTTRQGTFIRPRPIRAQTSPVPRSEDQEKTEEIEEDIQWEPLPSTASQIEIGKRDCVVILSDNRIYTLRASNTWLKLPGTSSSVSVGADGAIGAITKLGQVYFREANAKEWTKMMGLKDARHISVGSCKHIVVTQKNGSIHVWVKGSTWMKLSGVATQCAIGHDGELWRIGKDHKLYRWSSTNDSWKNINLTAKQIIVGDKNTVFMQARDGKVYQWRDRSFWEPTSIGNSNPPLAHLSVSSDGTLARILADRSIWICRTPISDTASVCSSSSSDSLNSRSNSSKTSPKLASFSTTNTSPTIGSLSTVGSFEDVSIGPPPNYAPPAVDFTTPTVNRSRAYSYSSVDPPDLPPLERIDDVNRQNESKDPFE